MGKLLRIAILLGLALLVSTEALSSEKGEQFLVNGSVGRLP